MSLLSRENLLTQYLSACSTGNIAALKTYTPEESLLQIDYRFTRGVQEACTHNQVEAVKYLLEKLSHTYRGSYNHENGIVYDYGYTVEKFRENLPTITHQDKLQILKFFIETMGGFPNLNDFEKCATQASRQGDLEVVKYLMSTGSAQQFIEYKKYYNALLTPGEKKGNGVIEYFLQTPELSQHIKLLPLLHKAYEASNRELIEYMVFNHNMLYSKKVRKAVEHMNDAQCNIPQMFANREKWQFSQHLQEQLPSKETASHRVKL